MITTLSNRYLKSASLFSEAQKHIPGGVNSPVRSFKSVGGTPVFMTKAMGAEIWDADGNSYIEYMNSWGPMILGHSHPAVVEALKRQVETATSFGAPTELETSLAELIKEMVPGLDLVRFVNSGTEACMSALRIARGYTKRNKFIKFSGCYHGHADAFLVSAGSGLATLSIQNTPGVPSSVTEDTLVARYNDLEQVEALFAQYPDQIAAIIVEPVAGNMGCVRPEKGFLESLRAACTANGALLIFDEVMTGFRLAPGGVQEKMNIKADLVTYGKVIGGGMPIGAFGGKKEVMQSVAPLGEVYQAGTLSGNPLAVTAGYSTLKELHDRPEIYQKIDGIGERLAKEIHGILKENGIEHSINQEGSMLSVFFGSEAVHRIEDFEHVSIERFNQFFHHLLQSGIYLPPSAYETWFLSDALSESHIDKTLEAIRAFRPK